MVLYFSATLPDDLASLPSLPDPSTTLRHESLTYAMIRTVSVIVRPVTPPKRKLTFRPSRLRPGYAPGGEVITRHVSDPVPDQPPPLPEFGIREGQHRPKCRHFNRNPNSNRRV